MHLVAIAAVIIARFGKDTKLLDGGLFIIFIVIKSSTIRGV